MAFDRTRIAGRLFLTLFLIPLIGCVCSVMLALIPPGGDYRVPLIGSLACIGLSATLLALVHAGARLARGSRERLVVLFGLGRRLVLLGTAVLVILQGLITAFVVGVVPGTVLGMVPGPLVLVVVIGTVFVGPALLISSLRRFGPPNQSEIGIAVSEQQQPRLWQLVRDVAARLEASPPDNLVLSLQPGMYATGARVRVGNLADALAGETLCLSLPMLRIMSVPEAAAVIGHELGHLRAHDTAYTLRFVPVYTHMGQTLQSLSAIKGMAALPVLPAAAVLGFFLRQFAGLEREIGRQREIEADQAGVAVAGAEALASALVRTAFSANFWRAIQQQLRELLQHGKMFTNVSRAFADLTAAHLRALSIAAAVEALASLNVPHPYDTHPPVAARLAAIGISPADAIAALTQQHDPAIGLVEDSEPLETMLTSLYTRLTLQTIQPAQRSAAH